MFKHKHATRTSGYGRKTWKNLQFENLKVNGGTIRAKTAELATITTKLGVNLDDSSQNRQSSA